MKSPGERDIYLLSARRTPFGRFGGALRDLSATDLAVVAARAALEAAQIDPAAVDAVIFGNVAQTSADAIYLARHVALRSGVPEATPALTVNRQCGSGFQAIISGAQEILLGEAEVALVGGTESMSQVPHVLRGARWGMRLGAAFELEDMIGASSVDPYCGLSMGITAEALADEFGISREAADAYALRSQQAWAAAQDAGRFADELAPVDLAGRKGPQRLSVDEHPRRDTTLAAMAALPPAFKRGGVITAANASGIADGAAAIVLASGDAVARLGLAPLARLVGWRVVGVEPARMGIGPVPAIRGLLARAGIAQDDVDLFEINEAFAPQTLACEAALALERARTNVDGGAIALGHPLAATGARLVGHLAHRLRGGAGRLGVAAACVGGGQGIALALESA